MQSLSQFIESKHNFLIKGHTKKQDKSYEVYNLIEHESYGVRMESKEDIDAFIDKAYNDAVKLNSNDDDGPVKRGKTILKNDLDNGQYVFIIMPDTKDYRHTSGFLRYSCRELYVKQKCKFVGTVTLKDFNLEYFKNKGWVK